MSKFCTNCGHQLNESADVCMNCGVLVNKVVSNNNVPDCEKSANTGFVLGLISIVAWFIPLFGYPVTICGIVYSSKGLKAKDNQTKATVGLVLSIIFLIITFVNSLLGALMNIAAL